MGGGDLTGQGPGAFARAGVGHIPEDRLGSGPAPALSVADNAVLREYARPPVARGPFLSLAAARRLACAIAEAASVAVPDFAMPMRKMSGGNRPRPVARRKMRIATRVLVAAHPSRGLDTGAINTMVRYFVELRDAGIAVVLISDAREALLNLADRIAVMYDARIIGKAPPRRDAMGSIGLTMGGERAGAAP